MSAHRADAVEPTRDGDNSALKNVSARAAQSLHQETDQLLRSTGSCNAARNDGHSNHLMITPIDELVTTQKNNLPLVLHLPNDSKRIDPLDPKSPCLPSRVRDPFYPLQPPGEPKYPLPLPIQLPKDQMPNDPFYPKAPFPRPKDPFYPDRPTLPEYPLPIDRIPKELLPKYPRPNDPAPLPDHPGLPKVLDPSHPHHGHDGHHHKHHQRHHGDQLDASQIRESKNGHVRPEIPHDSPEGRKLDKHNVVDRIVAAISRNEGKFTTINTNDGGHGWSVGIRQWNQEKGEMPNLLLAMFKHDPEKFKRDFGPYASKIIHNIDDPAHATVNENWVRHTNFNHLDGFKGRMQTALNDFQDVQVALARKFVEQGIKIAEGAGFKSELGMAVVCDIINQKGLRGLKDALRHVPPGGDERSRIMALEHATHRPNGRSRLASLVGQFSAHELDRSQNA
jgi:hypothetical protein